MTEHIAFIGLGNMGLPMAQNLIKAGFRLRVYNRTPEKAETLVKSGAQQAATPAETVESVNIVITMVANDKALEEIVFGTHGIRRRLGKGMIHLSMSTISPETSDKLAHFHQENGADYIAAPVFGRPEAAADQKLWICVAGPDEAKKRVKPILNTLGQGLFDLGSNASHANVAKLTGNFLILSAIEAMAEAYAFAEKNGLDRNQLAFIFSQTFFNCPIYQNYGKMIATQSYEPAGFKLNLGLKDINLLIHTAKKAQATLPLAQLLQERLLSSVKKGRQDMDWTAIALESLEDVGLTSSHPTHR